MLARGAVRRCPLCGSPGLWRTWFRMNDHCPRCGLHLERGEQGYIVGAYMFNIVAAELVFAALLVTVLLLTWPTPPWALIQVGGAIVMVAMPVFFYPFAKTLFLAFDLVFRPKQ